MKEADAGVTVPEKRKGKKADKLSDAGVAVGAVVDGGDMVRSVDENCADCGKLVLSNHSTIKCDVVLAPHCLRRNHRRCVHLPM